MSYPMTMPYNFNDMYSMLGYWGAQNQTNTNYLNQYTPFFQYPTFQCPTFTPISSQISTTQTPSDTKSQDSDKNDGIKPQTSQVQTPVQKPTTIQVPKQPQMDPDDGVISWGKKLKNFGKGMVNMVKGMFCDEKGFSLKRTLTTVAVAAGAVALTVATGGAAAPFLVAAGATMGAVQIGKGAYKAATAKTDAEAEAAWQEMGSGTLAVGLSVAGAKGAIKAAGKPVPTGRMSAIKATGECFKTAGEGVKSAVMHPKNTLGLMTDSNTWSTAGSRLKTAWNDKMDLNNSKTNAKASLEKAYDKDIAKIQKNADKLANEISELKSKPQTDALKLEIKQKTARLEKMYRDMDQVRSNKANIQENIAAVDNKAEVTRLQNELKQLNAELKEMKELYPDADLTAIKNDIAAKTELIAKARAQQTPAGARKAAIEEIETNIKELETQMKEASKTRKPVYERRINAAKRQLAEAKKFGKIEENLELVNSYNAKNVKLKAAIEKIDAKIADVKNGTLSEAQKAIELAKLNRHKTNCQALISENNTRAFAAKVGLYKSNAIEAFNTTPAYQKALIVGIAGGLRNNAVEENSALADYQRDVEAYNQALLEAQQEYEEMMAQEQAQQTQQTQQPQSSSAQEATPAQTTTAQTPQYNPYLAYDNSGTYKGFNDLYVSAYPDLTF